MPEKPKRTQKPKMVADWTFLTDIPRIRCSPPLGAQWPQGQKGRWSMRRLFFALGLVVIPAVVWGACTWQWDCSKGYPCTQIPVCDNTFDTPPPKAPGVSPMPPPTIPLPPISPAVPSPGASMCRHVYICNGTGQCGYQKICQ
jgi:hypothetical protein